MTADVRPPHEDGRDDAPQREHAAEAGREDRAAVVGPPIEDVLARGRMTPPLPPLTIPGYVRQARRRADMSQRELARAAGIHASTVGRIEAGELTPSLRIFRKILGIGGMMLAVVDTLGRVVPPMQDWVSARDGAERRYPSHLDTILDPLPGEWWGDTYGLARPPETFYRDRRRRDAQRKRSQWEVRVAQYRHEPMPPLPRRDPGG
jgi:transcriptional regulator with XRE-family HTH domain